MNLKSVIIPAVIIITSAIAVFAIDSVNLDKLCAEKGGVRHGSLPEELLELMEER
jgi:hypothetical protein